MKRHASMNRIYRLVWNPTSGMLVAVAENAKGHSKSISKRKLIAAAFVFTGSVFLSPLATAEPTGGQVSAGAGTIAQAGTTTTITQSSQNLAINWQSFGIAANEAVNFAQPNTSAIALNRVTGQNPSSILGSLSANGQVFILNPNGVLFGAGSQVNVGGLVASTLNLSDADLMAGKHVFGTPLPQAGDGQVRGSVVNQGTLTAAQSGYIALLAPEVRNEGVISATLGTALLAAGDKVTLNLNNGSLLSYSIDQGSLNALAENKQLIQADGGQVFMSVKAANALSTAMVNNTGIIEARTVQNVAGVIMLMGDMQVGTVSVGGTLDASAPNGGNGGFVETSAAHVKVADATQINTTAPQGISGTWLIDPTDYFIGVDISAATLASNLSAGNITIQTIAAGAGNGDIFVNVPVTWSSSNKLTLNAYRDINFNASITNSAGGSLVLRSDMTGTGSGTINNNGASVNLSGGGRADLYYNPTSYVAPTNFASFLGATPYTAWMLVNDATNLQGMSTNLGGAYALGKDIDATATSTWNSGAGFAPVGNSSTPFIGTLDGLGHTIEKLTINRPATNYLGLFGYTNGAAIKNVGLVGGSVSGGGSVGGLAGVNSGTITNSYSTGSVSGVGNVGGLAGENSGTITNSYATGSVSVTGTGSNSFGGLVGYNSGTISNSYATGNVSGIFYVGGLVGPNYGGTISNSYATGAVTGNSVVGGLAGDNSYGGTITNSYWDTETSGQSSSAGGTGKTSAQMRQQATFSGFDFTNSWWLSEGDTRPFLRSEYSTTITNAHQLQLMAMNLGASYTLSADINMAELTNPSGMWNTATGFAPIGDGSGGPGDTSTFTGTFDGLGHTISNLTINRTTIDLVGLFGYTGTGSAIRNVGLVGGSVSGMGFVGGLVGSNTGTVSNSYATGSVSGSNNYVGGLVGNNQGIVSSSYATGSVSGGGSVGGLVGHNGGTVSTSYAAGSVSGSGYSVGGLAGSNYGTVSGSYAITGSVSGTNEVGGLVGNNSNGGTVSTSYATGGVNGSGEFVGGLVGSNGSTVSNSYATGGVSGTNYVGGLAGGNGGTVSDSYATGSVIWNGVICCGGTGPDRGGEGFGGLVGYNYGTVSNSYSTGGVGGISYVGGLVGLNEDTVSNSHATGDVSGGDGSSYIGGLMGYNITVINSYATGSVVSGSGSSYIGGLVGNNGDTVSNSYATGSVMTGTSSSYVGGLAGNNDNCTISNSYATGNVTGGAGSGYVGGLVGKNSYDFNGDAGGWVINSYATGSVTGGVGSSYVGGLAGSNGIVSNISNSYWDTQTTGQSIGIGVGTTSGATGRTSAQMMLMSTFSNAGWDIANAGGSGAVWRIYEGSTTPWLVWWLKPVTVTLNSDTQTYSGAPYSGGNGYAVGNPDPSLSGTVGSPNPVLSGTLAYSGTSQSAVNAGSYTISASGLYSIQQGYDISYMAGTLAINKAHLTVTADNKSRLYGQANPALTTTVSGFVNGENAGTAAGFAGTGSATTLADLTTNVGTAAITAGAGNLAATNYAFTNLIDGTLTITPASVPSEPLPVSGILPAVVEAITALPGGADLLPAFSSTVTVAATQIDAVAPPPALSNLQYMYVATATPGNLSGDIDTTADGKAVPTKAQGGWSDGFNERLSDAPIQFTGTVIIRNGGIKLSSDADDSNERDQKIGNE